MREYSIRITRQARENLRGISDYISLELKAPEAAQNTISAIKREVLDLSTMPGRIKLTDEEPWRSKKVHRMLVKNYYVYFWIDEEKYAVYVLAVIYVARNQEEQLKKIL